MNSNRSDFVKEDLIAHSNPINDSDLTDLIKNSNATDGQVLAALYGLKSYTTDCSNKLLQFRPNIDLEAVKVLTSKPNWTILMEDLTFVFYDEVIETDMGNDEILFEFTNAYNVPYASTNSANPVTVTHRLFGCNTKKWVCGIKVGTTTRPNPDGETTTTQVTCKTNDNKKCHRI